MLKNTAFSRRASGWTRLSLLLAALACVGGIGRLYWEFRLGVEAQARIAYLREAKDRIDSLVVDFVQFEAAPDTRSAYHLLRTMDELMQLPSEQRAVLSQMTAYQAVEPSLAKALSDANFTFGADWRKNLVPSPDRALVFSKLLRSRKIPEQLVTISLTLRYQLGQEGKAWHDLQPRLVALNTLHPFVVAKDSAYYQVLAPYPKGLSIRTAASD